MEIAFCVANWRFMLSRVERIAVVTSCVDEITMTPTMAIATSASTRVMPAWRLMSASLLFNDVWTATEEVVPQLQTDLIEHGLVVIDLGHIRAARHVSVSTRDHGTVDDSGRSHAEVSLHPDQAAVIGVRLRIEDQIAEDHQDSAAGEFPGRIERCVS